MSHSYQATNGTTFHHNSDFYGDCSVINKDGKTVDISAKDILKFVTQQYLKPKMISRIEQATVEDFFYSKGL